MIKAPLIFSQLQLKQKCGKGYQSSKCIIYRMSSIITCSWVLYIRTDFWKKPWKQRNGIQIWGKNIQAVAYNGAHKVEMFIWYFKKPSKSATITFTFQNHNGVSRWIPYIWRWLQLPFYWNKIGVHKKQPRSPCRWILFPNSSILLAIPTILCN